MLKVEGRKRTLKEGVMVDGTREETGAGGAEAVIARVGVMIDPGTGVVFLVLTLLVPLLASVVLVVLVILEQHLHSHHQSRYNQLSSVIL